MNENKQFKKKRKKCIISNSYLIRLNFLGYCRKSGIKIFACIGSLEITRTVPLII